MPFATLMGKGVLNVESVFLYIMIISLLVIFTVDAFQKRQNDLKRGKSK
ncbi:MAG: hypothetical protein Kow0070_01520 [Anaerolineales bacterium]